MALFNCPECGKQVSDTAPACIHCGYPIIVNKESNKSIRPKDRRSNSLIALVSVLLTILIIWTVIMILDDKTENKNEQAQANTNTEISNEEGLKNEKEQIKIYKRDNYKIIDYKSFKPRKCVLNVRIQEALNYKQIKDIATQIRDDYPSYYRLLIFYFLPDMKISDGAWATSHYDTELEVKILGTPEEQNARIEKSKTNKDATQEKKEINPKILGKWYCNTPGVKHTIKIYKVGNTLKATQVWPFELTDTETIREGRNGRYDIISSNFGEYYILKSNGILELWDRDGRFAIATKK